jgi:hypothetical protein
VGTEKVGELVTDGTPPGTGVPGEEVVQPATIIRNTDNARTIIFFIISPQIGTFCRIKIWVTGKKVLLSGNFQIRLSGRKPENSHHGSVSCMREGNIEGYEVL